MIKCFISTVHSSWMWRRPVWYRGSNAPKQSVATCPHSTVSDPFPIQGTVLATAYQLSPLTSSHPHFLLLPLIFSFVFPLIIISILKMTTDTSSEAQSIPIRLDGIKSQKLLTPYSPQGAAMAQSVQLLSYRTWTVRGSKFWRGKIYTLLQTVGHYVGPPNPLFNGCWPSLLGDKAAGKWCWTLTSV